MPVFLQTSSPQQCFLHINSKTRTPGAQGTKADSMTTMWLLGMTITNLLL